MDQLDKLYRLLSQGPQKSAPLKAELGVSQPTLSRLLARMGPDAVRLGAARSAQYALRDRNRGLGDISVYRVNTEGQLQRLGVLVPVRPEGFVMHHEDGRSSHSPGLPWWLMDMRPQGFLGRAYAQRHALALGLPAQVRHWSDTDALRALLQHGHDAVGHLLLGDQAHASFLSQPQPRAVAGTDKADTYTHMALQAMEGDFAASSAAGEQPKFTAYAHTPVGPRHVLVKFSLPEDNLITERWRDLLLAEHHALETLREGKLAAAQSWIHDNGHGQRFLEVERFDRAGPAGRRGLLSLAALDAEFVGKAHEPWHVLVAELAQHKAVRKEANEATQALHAFGVLIGNTDMHSGNLSFLDESGPPYALAPAYDMLPMAFQPKSGGALGHSLPPLKLHPHVAHGIWRRMLPLAERFLRALQADSRLSAGFSSCSQALTAQLQEAEKKIAMLS
jgi:hypothetical protein